MHSVEHAYQMGFEDGYRAAERQVFMDNYMGNPANPMQAMRTNPNIRIPNAPKPKRKPSAYNRRLGREIKALTKRHKTKAGKWKKGWSQKRMMKAAHKAAQR